MNNLRFVLVTILLTTISLFGFDKASFDITESDFASNDALNTLAKIPYPGLDFLTIEAGGMEAHLLKEGYFTVGTTLGSDQGVLDDNQPLTYGHPFAKTSYPYFTMDGIEYRLDQYFSDSEYLFESQGDSEISLILSNTILACTFSIIKVIEDGAEQLSLRMTIENLDTSPHDISTGVLFDPALGTWGDGALSINGVPVESTYTHDLIGPFGGAVIDERRNLNTGMQLLLRFDELFAPSAFKAGNWPVLAGYQDSTVEDLFDIALQWENSNMSVLPDSLVASGFTILLGDADYPEGPYIRSQLPQMLALYEGLVYPSHFNCFTIINNEEGNETNDLVLTLRSDQLFEAWVSDPFFVGASARSYQTIPLHFPEVYEDRVYPLTLELKSGSDILDLIQQHVFVPASPYSDTGMVVLVDSVLIQNYPEVSARFSASEANSGRYLFELENQNMFVYEDQTRIYDFSLIPDSTSGNNAADVVFVLDVTGSMGGEIDAVKDNLGAFADSLESQGVDYRLAMVTFLDVVENIYDFTSDVDLFQTYVDAQYAHGGGDWKENSLDAIYAATQLQFRDQAAREFIWITDAGYHINTGPTSLTVENVVDALLLNGITCNAVAGTEIRVDYCEPITIPTGGDWFDIDGNFLDILLQISNWGGTHKYLLSFDSPNPGSNARTIGLEVHYAGMGGYGSIQYTPPASNLGKPSDLSVKCYPNPFNPSISIDLEVPPSYSARADIYNIRGQSIKAYHLHGSGAHSLQWNATDTGGHELSAGIYFLQVTLLNHTGDAASQQLIKLIHAK